MGVKVFCNSCEGFIRDIPQAHFKNLTGKEMCEVCGKRLDKVFEDIDKLQITLEADVKKKNDDLKKKYNTVSLAMQKFTTDLQSLIVTARAAVERSKQDIFK